MNNTKKPDQQNEKSKGQKSRRTVLAEMTRAELESLGVLGGLNPMPDDLPSV